MGGSTQKAPTPYQPANQAGADASFQAGAGALASQGQQLYSTVAPELGNISNAVQNNPYFGQAMAGANATASTASGTVAPSMLAGAAQDSRLGGFATSMLPGVTGGAALAPGVMAQTQNAMPMGTSAAGLAGPSAQKAFGMIDPTTIAGLQAANPTLYNGIMNALSSYGQSQGGINNVNSENSLMMGDAARTLNTAYDPQSALYDRSHQQMSEQTNAINAQNGVAGSPFGAGLSAQNNSNFNIDWQNAQLARQISALGAYGGAAQTATGDLNSSLATQAQDYTGLMGGAVGDYNALTSNAAHNTSELLGAGTSAYNTDINSAVGNLTALQSTGVNNYNSLTSGATNNAATLSNAAVTANQGASALGTDALNTMAGAAQLPSNTYLQQQQANLGAIGAQIQGTNAAASQTQQSVADQGNYLNIGQTASQGAIQAAQVNNQAAQASAAGFGKMFGDLLGIVGIAAAPFTGGASLGLTAGSGATAQQFPGMG